MQCAVFFEKLFKYLSDFDITNFVTHLASANRLQQSIIIIMRNRFQQVDPTRYLFPPYVAPAGIRQPSNAGARDKRKTPAAVANGLALSTTDFLAEHENDREEARAAASKLVPKTVPAPSKFQKNAPPPPKRVGRQG